MQSNFFETLARNKKTSEDKSYLGRLQFDPQLLRGFVARYIKNIRIVILLALAIALLGVTSYLNLPKRLNPEVKISIVSITTVLPGASPEDIESQITVPLENDVRTVKGIDTISSTSTDSVSIITIQFLSSINKDDAKKDVQSVVDSFTDLPTNANAPKVVALDFEDQPVWTFAMVGQHGEHALMTQSDELKQKIADLSKVDRVQLSGYETQQAVIILQPEKIQQYGFNPLQLSDELRKSLLSYPAGTVETDRNAFALTINPSITQVPDLRNLQLSLQGKIVNVGDIADVSERAQLDQPKAFVSSPSQLQQQAVTFYVFKNSTSNIDEAGKQVTDLVDQYSKQHPGQFKVVTLIKTSDEIAKQMTDLLGEFRSTILLVFICLFLFLGLRQAIISAFTIPLTFLSAFFFMQFFGMSINFLTLFALLLALGLLVDDTIVTVSAMTTYYKTGKFTAYQTGLLVWRDTIVPIWSTTITTIWSFVPLLISTGIIGEFIKPIPIVVTVTMLSSTAIAVLITLPVMIILLKPSIPVRVKMLGKIVFLLMTAGLLIFLVSGNPLFVAACLIYLLFMVVAYLALPVIFQRIRQKIQSVPILNKTSTTLRHYTDHGVINLEGLSKAYYRLIHHVLSDRSLRRKVIVGVVIYAVLNFMLLPLGFVSNEFFPKSDQDLLYVNVEYPAGTQLLDSTREAAKLTDQLRQTPETEFVITETGRSAGGGFTIGSNNNNLVSFSLHLKPKKERHLSSSKIADDLRKKFTNYTAGKLSVVEESGGPPAGADVQMKLSGEDLGILNTYADQIAQFMQKQTGLTNIEKSIKPGTSRIVFVPDYTKLADAGITVDQVGLWMRMYSSGFTLNSVNFDKATTTKEDIVFKVGDQLPTAASLGRITIANAQGVNYPILSLGHLETQANPTLITREKGVRTISVSASVTQGFSATEKNKDVQKFADSLHLKPGYVWATGGVNEENQKSVTSILQAMIVSFLLILITMVIQFGSFRQAAIVLMVIPLAVSSVFLIFAITGTPLSFPALIGVLSLFGIVVTNSMFIVDKINMNKRLGMPLKEAISDAGASRLEPIILTKLCTVLGLLPITLADPLWRGLGGAIISGILLSSTIMLLFIPSVYYSWFKGNEEK